jgi:hypothetical protein
MLGAGMVKNPYGLRNNDPTDWVNIYEVDRSNGDAFYCAECGTKFIAVQPSDPRKQWFFRHHRLCDCEASRETAIHLMAKQILVEERKIMLPYLVIEPEPKVYQEYKYHPEIKLYRLGERKLHHFDAVQDEVWMEGRVPDIVAVSRDRKLLVEVVVTHDIDEEKLNWIRKQNISTLKVSLEELPYRATKNEVKQCLITGRQYGKNIMWWVHHAKKQDHQKQANEHYIQQVREKGLAPQVKNQAESPRPPELVSSQLELKWNADLLSTG